MQGEGTSKGRHVSTISRGRDGVIQSQVRKGISCVSKVSLTKSMSVSDERPRGGKERGGSLY